MNTIQKVLAIVLFVAVPVFSYAQKDSDLFHYREIVVLEDDGGNSTYEVFAVDREEGSQYYLNLGHVGFGDELVQVQLDPVFTLIIKLGDSLDEAIETMEQLKAQVKATPGTTTQTTGYLGIAVAGDKTEEVTITTWKPLLVRYLQFSLQRDGYIRAVNVSKSDVSSLLFNLKVHRKLHPKEA